MTEQYLPVVEVTEGVWQIDPEYSGDAFDAANRDVRFEDAHFHVYSELRECYESRKCTLVTSHKWNCKMVSLRELDRLGVQAED